MSHFSAIKFNMVSNRCTEQSKCELGNTSYGWVSYAADICPQVTTVSDKVVANQKLNTIKVSLYLQYKMNHFNF